MEEDGVKEELEPVEEESLEEGGVKEELEPVEVKSELEGSSLDKDENGVLLLFVAPQEESKSVIKGMDIGFIIEPP